MHFVLDFLKNTFWRTEIVELFLSQFNCCFCTVLLTRLYVIGENRYKFNTQNKPTSSNISYNNIDTLVKSGLVYCTKSYISHILQKTSLGNCVKKKK